LADFDTGLNPFLRTIVIVQGNPYFGIVRASRDSLPSTQSSSLDLKKLETTQIPRRIREKNTWPNGRACNALFPDGTPVAGSLNYSIASSLLNFQRNAHLRNGQAQCVLFSNPSALGISAQFTINLNLTDTAGRQLWQLSLGMDPAQVNLGAIQTSSLNVVVQKL